MNTADRINKLMEQGDWPGARDVVLGELQKDPDNHWLLDQLSSTYYEEKDYPRALEVIKRAMRQMPTCPLVLWDYACTLDVIGQRHKAADIYRRLIRKQPRSHEYRECWEGKAWAASLKADCKYRLACYYDDVGKPRMAAKTYADYFSDLEKGIDSLYKAEAFRRNRRRTAELRRISS